MSGARWTVDRSGEQSAILTAMSERVGVPTAEGEMPAYLWRPEGGSGPGVLLVQEIFGVSDYIARRARDLADLGYVVLAPVLFWRLGVESVPNGPDMLAEGVGLVQRLDWPAAVRDCVDALAALRVRPEVTGPVGIVGFCFGGGLGYNVASVSEPDVLVSYYGSALPGLVDTVPLVTAPSLHHFGLADSFIDAASLEHVRAVVSQAPDCEFLTYEGADHAFDNADFVFYDEPASELAWVRTAQFLRRHLPT
jgi:carboxymethylenebutenolidase